VRSCERHSPQSVGCTDAGAASTGPFHRDWSLLTRMCPLEQDQTFRTSTFTGITWLLCYRAAVRRSATATTAAATSTASAALRHTDQSATGSGTTGTGCCTALGRSARAWCGRGALPARGAVEVA
jgi:hypothetical protein